MRSAGASATFVLTAVDTNVISALWSGGPLSRQAFELMRAARAEGQLVICSLVYAELLANPAADMDFVENFLKRARVEVDFRMDQRLCREAGSRFKAHSRRRQKARSGLPRRIVADFLIGAHALLHASRLLTWDAEDYKRDFPELTILPGRMQ